MGGNRLRQSRPGSGNPAAGAAGHRTGRLLWIRDQTGRDDAAAVDDSVVNEAQYFANDRGSLRISDQSERASGVLDRATQATNSEFGAVPVAQSPERNGPVRRRVAHPAADETIVECTDDTRQETGDAGPMVGRTRFAGAADREYGYLLLVHGYRVWPTNLSRTPDKC